MRLGGRQEWLIDVIRISTDRIRDVRERICDNALPNCIRTGRQIGIVRNVNSSCWIDGVVVLHDGTTVGTSTANDGR